MLIDFLRANANIFAWSPSDTPGILREVAEHSLDIRPNSKPIKQCLRRFDELKRRAIDEELQKLGLLTNLVAAPVLESHHDTV